MSLVVQKPVSLARWHLARCPRLLVPGAGIYWIYWTGCGVRAHTPAAKPLAAASPIGTACPSLSPTLGIGHAGTRTLPKKSPLPSLRPHLGGGILLLT